MNRVSFYIITDSHLVSKKTWVEGRPVTLRERGDQIALKVTPEILDTYIEKIIADNETDTVLFTGDNVNNADMDSHRDFKKYLERLTAAGKKVYVIYATHDYSGMGEDNNRFKSCRYTETGIEPVEAMRKNALFDFYKEYGPQQALSVHRESGSYTVKLGDGLRLVAIIDNGNGGGYCGLYEDGFLWLKNEIRSAKAEGDLVLLAVHHPVLPPWEVYRHVAEHEMFGGYRELRDIMCSEGVRVVFTGHTHIQNIRKYTDSQGRWFVDVSTIALANAAGKMRKVTVDVDKALCSVKSVGADEIKGVDTGELSAFEYMYRLNFPGIWERLLPLLTKDFNAFIELADGYLPVDKLKKHKLILQTAGRKVQKIKLSTAAKLGRTWKGLSDAQKTEAKNKYVKDVVFEIFRHIFAGNAPFTPDTTEYIAVNGLVERADRAVNLLNIKAVKNIIPDGSSLAEIVRDFLYNCRTGNDDEIDISLK